eukprot:5196126-Pyramimonas_sp.AAC.1
MSLELCILRDSEIQTNERRMRRRAAQRQDIPNSGSLDETKGPPGAPMQGRRLAQGPPCQTQMRATLWCA